jgi:hypothetical protein
MMEKFRTFMAHIVALRVGVLGAVFVLGGWFVVRGSFCVELARAILLGQMADVSSLAPT